MTQEEHGQGENLIIVYRAPDVFTANTVQGLLIGENIPAVLESKQVPWLNGVMKMGEGYWGDVVVPEEYAQRSCELIEAYQAEHTDEEVKNGDDQPTE